MSHCRPTRTAPTRTAWCSRSLAAAALGLCTLLGVVVCGPARADQIDDKRAEAQRIAHQLDELRRAQIQLAEDYNEANLRLDKANSDIAGAQVRVQAATREYEKHKAEARLYAIEGYVHGNDSPAINAVLTTDGDKAPQKQGYLQAANRQRQDTVDQLRSTRHQLDTEIAGLDQAKADASAAASNATNAKRSNDDKVAEQARLNDRAQGELGALVREEQQRQAQEQQRANEARLAELASAEKARQATESDRASTTAPRPPAGDTLTARPETTNSPVQPGPTGPAPAPRPAPGPVAPPAPKPAPPPPSAPVPPSGKGAAAAGIAMGQLGVPYVYGGATPRGFDCSGLVMWAYAQVGVSLPHATSAQWAATQPISMSELQVGDLIFFYGLGHVGIYIGGGSVVHAPHTGDVVRVERVANMPVTGARRVR